MELLRRIPPQPKTVHIDWRHCKKLSVLLGGTAWPQHCNPVVPPPGAIYNTHGCQKSILFSIHHWNMNVIKPWSKLLWVHHLVQQLHFSSLGCQIPIMERECAYCSVIHSNEWPACSILKQFLLDKLSLKSLA